MEILTEGEQEWVGVIIIRYYISHALSSFSPFHLQHHECFTNYIFPYFGRYGSLD